jgi:hypothetical protein
MSVLIVLGLVLSLVGLAGCVLPVLPGPLISFCALIVLSLAKGWEPFSWVFLAVFAGLTAAVSFLDYLVPLVGARKYGASRAGVWGSAIGMIGGLIVLPPWGMFFGAFAGALAGEVLARRGGEKAVRAAWGAFVGTVFGVGLKLAVSGVMLFFYLKEMF